jgi:hypothetical protein
MKNKILNFMKIGALAGFMAFMPLSCEREPPINFNPNKISNVIEIKNLNDLRSPSGLSSNYVYSSKKSATSNYLQNENLNVFAQGPRYSLDYQNNVNPAIYEFSFGNTKSDGFNINLLLEFDLKDYQDFFISPTTSSGGDGVLMKPYGITLENLVLEDGSILFSSSTSEKLLKINSSKEISTYLKDTQLWGITDILKSSDGKIYCAQIPLVVLRGEAGDTILITPKRVISIDDLSNINVEFELPTRVSLGEGLGSNYFEQLKIIENSPAGKEKFGTEFYVSDLLEDCIYKIDKDRNVRSLAKGLRYPSSILVDSIGDLFYTNTPLWYSLGGSEIEYPTEFRILNPETGESTLLYTFDERDVGEYTSSGSSLNVMYNGEEYVLPVGYNVSAILQETDSKIDFLFTNSHQGTLKQVTADKK